MKASDWANLVWYSLLILTFVIAVVWVVLDTRKRRKGRPPGRLTRAWNWLAVASSRLGADIRRLFASPRKRRQMELDEKMRAEEYRKQVLLRCICPSCEHKMLSVPAVLPSDGHKGTKYYCLNCGYERIERDEARD